MKRFMLTSVFIPCLLLLSGCTSSLMQKSALNNLTIPTAKSESAQIVFMRPSSFGGAIQSSVFDLKQNENKLADDIFIGIVSANTKVLYQAEPGFHLFMVIGENADFMQAHLQAGKTYYALVTPRMGWWKARFSLKPLHRSDLLSGDFKDWFESTDWYENTNASRQWSVDNWESVQDKKQEYLGKWGNKSESEKDELTLKESDGQ
ncbi:MAG: hypothetical protein LUQ11_12520 [Methylococcaceae bacterium]|nr:hypothetical protein [Methylococcaceae bacterium]